MKKALVLVLTVLAFAGITAVAHADLDVFLNGWIGSYPSMWMGEQQATYGVTPTNHSITYSTAVGAGVGGEQAAKFLYDSSKESWAGEVVQAGGSGTGTMDLSAYTSLTFKLRKETGGPDVKIQKIFMTDGNGVEYDASGNTANDPSGKMITLTGGMADWSDALSVTIALPTSANLAAVNQLWGFVITAADNGSTGGQFAYYVDQVKYAGGGKGEVIVRINGGKRGISVAGVINFGTIAPSANVFSQDLSASSTPPSDSHFIITNLGDQKDEILTVGLSNPAGWTAVNQPNFALMTGNQYVLEAILNSGIPTKSLFDSNFANLVLVGGASKACNGTFFAGDETGNPIVKNNGTANMWLRFVAPPSTSTSAEMHLFVNIGFVQ